MRRMIAVAAAIALLAVAGPAQVEAQIECSQSAQSCGGGGTYTNLFGPTANTLELRNGTNAQTFNIYNTYTDASNFERARLGWTANEFFIDVTNQDGAGTGITRNIILNGSPVTVATGASYGLLSFGNVSGTQQGFVEATAVTFRTNGTAHGFSIWPGSIQGSKSKALADASATQFVRVAIPQTAGSNYAAGNVEYTVMARKGTDIQVLHGEAKFACINNAGTESCAAIVESYKTAAVVTAGTLTCAITAVTGLTDEIALAANCDTSLTATLDGFTIQYRLDMPQPNTVTPQ